MEHPADEVLLRFLAGTSSRQENREIVRHLLSRCAVCAARLRTLDEEPPEEPGAYEAAVSRCAAWLREQGGGRGEGGRPGRFRRSANSIRKQSCG